ncbi:hypothetical protein OM341_17140 [Escherichia albertii]|nr:hypothetical protein [Escherichia albertii]
MVNKGFCDGGHAKKIVQMLFFFFFGAQFLYVYSGYIVFQFINMVVGAFSFFYIYKFIHRNAFLLVICLAIFATLTTLISFKYKIGDVVFAITMPFFAMLLFLYRKELTLPAIIYACITTCYCGYAIIMGWDLNTQLFLSSSRNYISVLGIFSLYCVVISEAKNYIKFVLFILVFLVILYSGSRSAFISFLFVLFFWGVQFSKKHKLSFFCFFLLCLAFFLFIMQEYFSLVYDYIYNSLSVVRRLDAGELSDSGRYNVLKCYYDKLNIMSVFLGLDYFSNNTCSFLANGTDNPHNSFIRLYANLGFFSFVIIGFIIWSLFSLLLAGKYFLAGFLLCFVFRGGTDIIFFFQSWDAYLYSIMFISLPMFFLNGRGKEKLKH